MAAARFARLRLGGPIVRRLVVALIGRRINLPGSLVARYPELREARWRRGGLPPRIGGWCLGTRSVSAITLWSTVFLGDDAPVEAELLLHELRHVHQFQAGPTFPLLYLWQSARHGYMNNRYESDARAYAARRLRGRP